MLKKHMKRLLLLCVGVTFICGAWMAPNMMCASPCKEGCFTAKDLCTDAETFLQYAADVAYNGNDPSADPDLEPDTRATIHKSWYSDCTSCQCVDVHCSTLCEGIHEGGEYNKGGNVTIETECLSSS